ncbi:50S ribosomal protein L6 [Wolinella succinogenes]|uniref:Large ribosomal subunit protein uL6 n=1 Tax=Wolinella succinogenes (strain ATCC 29543 / DSM 1740 / CCUG 13145 / JCM 31913 / LMG 7466 / NCTC 11488 / FDC 602W) TaxID=273121 RepID=RL6_WOLSU|nr:50S ribosomal protein L6 [Wolinella succinogenes]Q7M8E7.1 RecName: Full=Large ribosomal subunit protein uL6; AltName: Full=50S ribosomal protein L6 [Wolinella succinogenes DSM 1740]HCZ18596.1 50S ribosomal protein L6 [Helicobacter sp.]NLU34656.1 50S ribosomal protein L6 [Wolinella succinogenes]CAE10729.1 50S RIBOSOMAL PROTEIN L6 [Wolinella succinogenes]VEG80877.1 50S ribosomal protein L6 [Wolinella succinogenes]
MSRIGKRPISIPSGVDAKIEGSKIVFTKGKQEKVLETYGRVGLEIANGELVLKLGGEDAQSKAYWGTYRALANNIVIGLSAGFTKQLEINGVGYKAAVKGSVLELALGFSHPVNYEIPEGVEIAVEKNVITIKGSDKQQIGQIAAEIREFRPPEPYKGKGVKYSDETIIRKAGKTSKK